MSAPGHAPDCDACCRETRSCFQRSDMARLATRQVELVTRTSELEGALVALLGAVDAKAFMTPDQQLAMHRARKAVVK